MRQDLSLSALVAGVIAVVVSYAGPLVIVFQAAQAAQLGPELLSSWIWAISIGAGLTAITLSLRFRAPVITAWSTPGAALLVTALPGVTLPQAIGAYLFSAALITLFGWSGWFDALMKRVPRAIAAAMLAGILLRFATDVLGAARSAPMLVGAMFVLFLVLKRLQPRYAIAGVLLGGTAFAALAGDLRLEALSLTWARPVWTTPEFDLRTMLGLGLPLCLVTLTGQFVPGIAVMRAAGYTTPANPLVTTNGIASLLLAPFGAHGINLAAITAAICTGPEAHENPARRYVAGVACGALYLVVGAFGATLAALFAALPHALVAAVAGLALMGAIQNGLGGAMADEGQREAALVTFVVTASGTVFLGLGAAFWGLALGLATNAVLSRGPTAFTQALRGWFSARWAPGERQAP